MEFCESYSKHFVGRGINSVSHARHYLSGLLGKERRKNIERIELDVKGSNYQGMEQFISSSPWSHQQLMNHIAEDADTLLLFVVAIQYRNPSLFSWVDNGKHPHVFIYHSRI